MTKDQQIIAAVIIYILGYIYSLVFANLLIIKRSKLNTIHEHCFLKGEPLLPRGRNYYINGIHKKMDSEHCILTFWSMTHVFLYIFLGYYCPDLFLETFVAGIAFELFEAQYYECHDLLDIFLNTLGFGIGYTLSHL